MFWFIQNHSLMEKSVVLHIKPYNMDIYDHTQCSTALLWPMVQSWELETLADVTDSWRQPRFRGISSDSTICHEVKQQLLTPETAVSAASGHKQTAVSSLLAAVWLCILVLQHERTPLYIQWLSRLVKHLFSTDCCSTWNAPKPPLFSASGDVSSELQLPWQHRLS